MLPWKPQPIPEGTVFEHTEIIDGETLENLRNKILYLASLDVHLEYIQRLIATVDYLKAVNNG